MGKYMRKCKGVGEVAVMEVAQVGVRTRARSMAMAMAAENSQGEKRRKVRASAELSFSSSLAQVRAATPENSVSQAASSDQCHVSAGSDHVMSSSSCCSSNGSTEVPKDRTLKLVDLEGDGVEIETLRCNLGSRERRETTPSREFQVETGEMESTAKAPPSAGNSSRISMLEKIPTPPEIEEFFAAAEEKMAKEFAEKYNYDIVKEIPLEGRYEWVKLKP